MIKRCYSVSIRALYGDGTGSYSYWNTFTVRQSWLPQHSQAYNNAFSDAAKQYPNRQLELISFTYLGLYFGTTTPKEG
jgi:hypothetical protein